MFKHKFKIYKNHFINQLLTQVFHLHSCTINLLHYLITKSSFIIDKNTVQYGLKG